MKIKANLFKKCFEQSKILEVQGDTACNKSWDIW